MMPTAMPTFCPAVRDPLGWAVSPLPSLDPGAALVAALVSAARELVLVLRTNVLSVELRVAEEDALDEALLVGTLTVEGPSLDGGGGAVLVLACAPARGVMTLAPLRRPAAAQGLP